MIFTASDPTHAEWQTLLRALYADGGMFAAQCSYGEFLRRRFRPDSANGRVAHARELAWCAAKPMPRKQAEMKELLEQATHSAAPNTEPQQIEFAL